MDHDREIAAESISRRFAKNKVQKACHQPGEFHDSSLVFWSRHCSRKGARRAEERRKKEEEENRRR